MQLLSRDVDYIMQPNKRKEFMYDDQEIMERSIVALSLLLLVGKSTAPCLNTGRSNSKDVLFHPPTSGVVIEKFILYRLRFDGIACTQYSKKDNTYYQLGLEIANCNECPRRKVIMTCHGMVFTQDRMHFVKDYLHRVTVLGINGVWIRKVVNNQTVWYHWRWAIMSVPCDTVAQEQLIGQRNKKFTNEYCLFCDAEKNRFNVLFYQLQPFSLQYDVTDKRKLTMMDQPLNTLSPKSFLRCPSLIFHAQSAKKLIKSCKKRVYVLTEEQKKDIRTLKKFLNIFTRKPHQYLPNVLPDEDVFNFWKSTYMEIEYDVDDITFEEHSHSFKINHLENNLLIPQNEALALDSMHNLTNICVIFMAIIHDKANASVDQPKLHMEYIREMLQIEDPEWTLDPSFKNILGDASKRLAILYKKKLVDKDLFAYNNYQRATCYNKILSLCSFYAYIFQDNLSHPVIFLFKVVFDYLVEFYNVNYNISRLVEKQTVYNIILGLLQNELLPGFLKVSVFNSVHYLNTILNCGDIPAISCFLQEFLYSLTRKNTTACRYPEKNLSSRLMMMRFAYHSCLEEEFETRCEEKWLAIPETICFNPQWLDSPVTFSTDILLKTIKCNLIDELSFYRDSSYSRETFLDIMFQNSIDLSYECLDDYLNPYLNRLDMNVEITKMTSFYNEHLRSYDIPHIKISQELYTRNGELIEDRLALTRLKNGKIRLFYVVGFISFKINNINYSNVLCIDVPASSGASYVDTTTYGFIELQEFSIHNSKLYLISPHRLLMDKMRTLEFGEKLQYVTNKLIIRQYQPILNNKLLNSIINSRRE